MLEEHVCVADGCMMGLSICRKVGDLQKLLEIRVSAQGGQFPAGDREYDSSDVPVGSR